MLRNNLPKGDKMSAQEKSDTLVTILNEWLDKKKDNNLSSIADNYLNTQSTDINERLSRFLTKDDILVYAEGLIGKFLSAYKLTSFGRTYNNTLPYRGASHVKMLMLTRMIQQAVFFVIYLQENQTNIST